ncbi:Helicase associated domain (HA2) [Phytophthora infestans]|uniref:Helicase associated domain (HA2) n=1 Tax=Phytophthora infestans TaxID=4787 RepID=A0A833SGA0_PHYIN|nr:Helicase associated domain (HA2) [Phytophthora infestans]
MGVRGLTRYCRQNEASTSVEDLDLHDVTLAVDFVGFLYYLCEELFNESNASPSWLLLGGCTLRLERYVDTWLKRLRERKVRLVFITDPPQCFGGESHRKGYCLQDRAMQKAQQIEQLAQSLEKNSIISSTHESASTTSSAGLEAQSPQQKGKVARTLLQTNGRFPFAREKLRGVLKKHGIGIKTASREADEELGTLVRTGKAFAVLAEDSDFLVMSGVRYIPFKSLGFYQCGQNLEQMRIRARVFSSEMVADSLGLEVEQLVDLALLCGNDFTSLLDNEYEMATLLDFPVQRMQGSLYPTDAARYVAGRMSILENPFLVEVETKKKGFLRALFEIYRFYGHTAAFLKKFPMAVESILPAKKLKQYKLLIDHYDFPPMAIDILETKARGLSQRFDALAAIPGLEDKSLDEFQAPARRLSYLVLDTPAVEEGTFNSCVVVHVAPLEFLRPLISVPIQGRGTNVVERVFRSLMFVLLYEAPDGKTLRAGQLAGLLGGKDKKGVAVRVIVYSLLVLWKQDRTYLTNASLLDDRLLELLLLTSLISFAVDSSKRKPGDRDPVLFDEQLLKMEIYAVVGGYLEILKQLHQLRLLLGSKSPQNSGCLTYFSGEVFVKVCHILMRNGSSAKVKSPKSAAKLSRREVEPVIKAFAEISDKNLFWSHYTYVRATTLRMKELIVLPVAVARASVKNKSAATTALETAMQSYGYTRADGHELQPATATPPLPLCSPPHIQRPAPAFSPSPVAVNARPPPLDASASTFNSRSVKGLMPSSVAKRLGTDSAMRDGAAYISESEPEPKKPVSLKGMIKTLPVFAHREEILENVAANQLTIIQGETGCGKSTSVPQFLYDSWARDKAAFERPVNIYVTQPRRIAAIELANTVARMREGNEFKEDGQVGKAIGYRIGQKHLTSSKTKITYVTTGYMVERIIHDPEALMKITHLVLDEVHERSMDVDLLLLLLKLQLKKQPHLRLVIMSATMDAQVLIKYLGKALSTRLVNRKPLFVGSKLYPVKNVYLDELSDWFPGLLRRCQKEMVLMRDQFRLLSQSRQSANSQVAKKAIAKIHEKQLIVVVEMVRLLIEGQRHQAGSQSQCILVFLPGIGSINTLYDSLSLVAMSARGQNVQVMVLHSGIELEHQQEAFKLLGGRSTKIILSTNIAESSVTIPDVTHVINCAIEKQIEMPNAGSSHAEVLVDTWCSRASALQRSGRAGRVMPGTAFHLFTAAFRDLCMAEYNTPELLRKPLDRIILQLKGQLNEFGVPSALLRQALDAPDLSHVDGAYKLLAAFDAIDSEDEGDSRLTKFGSFVCHLPLSLQLCRLLMTGAYTVQDNTSKGESWPLLLNTVILVAILAVPDLFVMPSFYHAQSAQSYLKEMKKNLQAKLKLDGGMWSEPLSIWLFYMETMSEQRVNVKRSLSGVFHKLSISARRYQTLNFLISDLCARLISLSKSKTEGFEQLLDAKAVVMLTKLDAYASSQRVDKKLLEFARDVVDDKRDGARILRFLIIQNFGEHLIGSTRDKPSKFADDDLDGTDRVDLKVSREEAAEFKSLPNRGKATLFNQLAKSANPMDELAALAYDGNTVSIYSYTTPRNQNEGGEDDENCFSEVTRDTVERMSFPVSLVYYISGEKFPVNLGMRPTPEERELAFKFRVGGSNSCGLTWQQQRNNVKASTGSRSLFSLPVRPLKTKTKKGTKEAKLLAVYADRLFTGDETRMWCTNCTLLPPTSLCYYPIMLLVTAPRYANIQLHMDAEAGEILLVKVGAQDATFPLKMALKVEVLATINVVRSALSDALNATVGARRVCVTDLLALSDDSVFMKESKVNAKRCKWQRMAMNGPGKAMLKGGETPARFPELFMA